MSRRSREEARQQEKEAKSRRALKERAYQETQRSVYARIYQEQDAMPDDYEEAFQEEVSPPGRKGKRGRTVLITLLLMLLALVGAVKGYKVIIIMPDSVSAERRLLITQYGAELRLIHDDGDIGKAIDECIATAKEMAASDPRVFMPDQFTNPENLQAHIRGTALEIIEQVDSPIHGFCSGVGTGGTLTGIGAVLKMRFPNLWICCAEPEHAAILSGGNIGSHMQMGIGDGLIPDILDTQLYNDINIVTDEEAISTTQALAKQEGILCGISSGTNVCTAQKMARKLGKGKTVVTILPDTGEWYFSTPLFQQGWREK